MIGPSFRVEIPRRSRTCSQGKESLTPGNEYYSALFESADGEKICRKDFCVSCWENNEREEKPISHWKAKIPVEPPQIENQQDQLDHVMDLFREALQENSEESDCEAYTLSLYLTRKKKLIYRKELKHQGQLGSLYEDPSTSEMFFVKKVPLQSLEQHQVVNTLEKRICSNSNE